ncbi:MAG: hypothetical protein JXR37_17045 [Kiritimatiellae bacterium]|nr:hypothetical protein [Kiritimatiellia bacterium]
MKRRSWREIKAGLKSQRLPGRMSEPVSFWADFRARARLRVQETPLPAGAAPRALRWALAAAGVLILAGWLGFQWLPSASAEHAPLNEIKSLEVLASHSAVLIMNDEPSQSTILWVVDMQSENGNKRDT